MVEIFVKEGGGITLFYLKKKKKKKRRRRTSGKIPGMTLDKHLSEAQRILDTGIPKGALIWLRVYLTFTLAVES